MTSINTEQRRYIRRETFVNTIVNTAISALFVWIVFRGLTTVPLWGRQGLALDLVPTSIAITLVSTLILTGLTRARLRRGTVQPLTTASRRRSWLPSNLLLRAVLAALLETAVVVPVTIGILLLAGYPGASFRQVLAFKLAFGAALSLLISPPLLAAALADGAGKAP